MNTDQEKIIATARERAKEAARAAKAAQKAADVARTYASKMLEEAKAAAFSGRGRIIVGALVYQDFRVLNWPRCLPPRREYAGEDYQWLAKDPNMIFDVYWDGVCWICRAYGYGVLSGGPDAYGNGSISLRDFDGVEVLSVE